MKVVLLAGGLGTRMREETEFRPKPMVEVGGKPIIWHIMKGFANFGYTDFVICGGYKVEQIKQFFFNYAAMNMDFTLRLGDSDSAIFHGSHEEFDWTVTVADTGLGTPTGGRVNKVRHFLDEEPFFCTYGDGLANVPINTLLEHHESSGKTATVTLSKPPSRFGLVRFNPAREIEGFEEKPVSASRVSIGFFAFNPTVFQYLKDDSILESDALPELAKSKQLAGFEHDGFWQPMDTQRELEILKDYWESGNPPWRTW